MTASEVTTKLSTKQGALVGITLFSMLFGAGNLILAPLMGVQAGTATPLALVGFIVSAVGLPVLCLAAIARAGSARDLIDRIHPVYSKLFMVLIYLSIGPCLAIPRTASTSYSMIEPLLRGFLPDQNAELIARVCFSALFFLCVFVLTQKPSKLTQILGKISGPLLIVMIVLIVGAMIVKPPLVSLSAPVGDYAKNTVVSGFLLGYQTMDVLAGFAYGIVIAMNIRDLGLTESKSVALQVIKSGVIAAALIALIYIGFAYMGMLMGPASQVEFANGAEVISAAASYQFGTLGVVVVAAIFLVACLNVSIALTCSISEYFAEQFPRFSYRTYAIATVLVGFILANVGLTSILAYSVPILLGLYPPALCFVAMGLYISHADKYPRVWQATIATVTLLSFTTALRDAFLPGLFLPQDALPFADLSLSWLVPTVVVFGVAQLISLKKN